MIRFCWQWVDSVVALWSLSGHRVDKLVCSQKTYSLCHPSPPLAEHIHSLYLLAKCRHCSSILANIHPSLLLATHIHSSHLMAKCIHCSSVLANVHSSLLSAKYISPLPLSRHIHSSLPLASHIHTSPPLAKHIHAFLCFAK